MPAKTLSYNVTFQDFQFLQGCMARRVFVKNIQKFGPAFLGIVVCAVLLGMVIFLNVNPHRVTTFAGMRYPSSFYVVIILLLILAIGSLMPAIKLRLKTSRLQVSNDGPLLGATQLTIESDGLVIDRKLLKTKYLWAAFQGVELTKKCIVLPIDTGIGVIIPAAAFSSDADRYDFAALIARRVQEQKPAYAEEAAAPRDEPRT